MKITAFILLVGCLHVSAKGYTQKVSLSYKNASLETIFSALEKQTNYVFFLEFGVLQRAKKVSIEVKDIPFTDALAECLRDQELTYSMVKNTVIIEPTKKVTAVNKEPASLNLIDIRGRIVNDRGEPVIATITVKGTKVGVTSNERGEFVIQGVDGSAVLVISGVGIEATEVRVDGRTFLSIAAKIVVKPLDEVQTIAYGTTSKRFSTGNISSIKSSDIEKQPVQNPLLAMQGRVPGLFITQSNGVPGGGVSVRIQGQTSISSLNGNDPLIIIDGVPYVSQMLSTVTGGVNGTGLLGKSGGPASAGNGNPLNYINPLDIESISILKDADATAIYGSRAANGAIIITTKKGKTGDTRVSINLQQGWSKVGNFLDMLSTPQYLEMRKEAFKNDNAAIGTSDYDLNGLWDTTKYTNWQKVLIGGTGKYTTINAGVTGGNSNIQYVLSSTFNNQGTVFPGNFKDKKGSIHFSVSGSSTNQRFNMQLSGNYMIDNNQLPGLDLTTAALFLAPNAPDLYNSDGSLNWALNSLGVSSWANPLQYLIGAYENKTKNLITNAVLSYKIAEGLSLKSSFGYTDLQVNEYQGLPLNYYAPEDRPFVPNPRFSFFGNNNINSWIVEPQINYNKSQGSNNFEALVGSTIQERTSNGTSISGRGYTSDQLLKDIFSASVITINATTSAIYKYSALFGRLHYDYNKKYLINFSIRRDGSSRFGANNQFHNFWSLGGGWIFTSEKLIQNNVNFLSFGKLRGSYGTTGNDQIPDYSFMNLLNSNNPGNPYQGTTGLSIVGLPNPYLQWEETKKLQIGIDLSLFKDRILLSSTYIRNRSSNQLLGYALPSTTGTSTIIENYPATIQNNAIEISLNSTNIQSKEVTWTSSFNITLPKNRVVSFPGLENSNQASLVVIGQPLGVKKAYRFAGVNPTSGTYQIYDKDGNITTTPTIADLTVLINTLPKFYGGFENSLQYKGFQLDFLFQFVKQIGSDFVYRGIPGRFLRGTNNEPASVLSRWQKPGDNTAIQKFSQNTSLTSFSGLFTGSDANYSDNSYVRLKNLSISYSLPSDFIKKVHLQLFRFFIQGQNLITITKYRGLDPESQSVFALPPLKTIVFGIQTNF